MRLSRLLPVLTLLGLITIITATTPGIAHAQIDESLPPSGDLSISAEPYETGRDWSVFVRADRIGDHPQAVFRNVRIQISAEAVRPGVQVAGIRLGAYFRLRGDGHFDKDTGILTIHELPRDGRAQELTLRPPEFLPGTVQAGDTVIVRVTAEIIGSYPVEPPQYQGNNAIEFWYTGSLFSHGDAGVNITEISDRSPGAGGTTIFTVSAENIFRTYSYGTRRFDLRDFNNDQFGVRVKVMLSPGLVFAGTQAAPSGTRFSAATGVWDIGTLEPGSTNVKSLPAEVNLTSDSLIDIPLDERCLTAEVISAVPWFASDLEKRENDVTSACLGEAPKLLPLTEGRFILLNILDCVDITTHPCTNADTVEIRARTGVTNEIELNALERRISRGLGLGGSRYIEPGQVTVQVRDHAGRVYDSGSTSLTDGATISWQTGREKSNPTEGVLVGYSRSGFNANIADWTSLVRTVTVSGLDGAAAPGRVRIRVDNSSGSTFYDPNPTHRRAPFALSRTSTTVAPYFLQFTRLGTYLVEFAVEVIRADAANTVYTGTGTYTFHVGPIAELAVWDAGASPAVDASRQAYTIVAMNNGPDEAPAVQVTGLPTGITEYAASEGDYDPSRGVWTIGKLGVSDSYRSSGHANAGPTLTLLTDDIAGAGFIAKIANIQDYSVVIDGATHSTHYYDHIPSNNTATITARAGTGAGHPDAPAGVTVMETSVANILMWQPVERVNGFEVTHYQVQRSASPWITVADEVGGTIWVDMAGGGQLRPYRVRAVNVFGVPGPWSRPTLTVPDAPGDFTAAQLGDGVVELTWTRPDGNGAEIDGYTLQVSTDGGASWSDTGAQLGGGDTGWVHRDASLGAGRLYRIRAITAYGPGPWAESASAVVGAPALTVLAQGPGEIWLWWTMPGGDDALVREYQLEHSTDGNSFRPLATVPAGGDMFYVHQNLSPNATRHYRIRAGTERGHGPWSEVVSTATGPGTPRNFRAQAGGPGEILLSWDAPSVRDAEVWEYELDQSTDGGAAWQHLAVIPAEEGTAYVHGGLPDGETRHYRVRAFSYYGGVVIPGEWSPARSATTVAGTPEAPKDLTAEADGENAVKLSWTEPADNGSPITGYLIEHSPDGGATWQALRDRHSGTSYRHGGLLSGTTHLYRVAALNRNGRSEFSSVAWAITGGDATTVPGMPTDLRVTGAERDRVSIAWGPPQNDGGTRVTGYQYRYFGPCANNPQDVCEGETRTTGGTSATISGLKTAGTYDFLVRAVNALGPGEWAGPVRAAVQPEARGRVTVAPASLTVNEGGSATYRVKLSTSPAWPVQVALFWEGDNSLSDSLAGHQGMILLPGGYALPEDGSWDGWAFPWNVGVPITVAALEDDDSEDGAALVHHEIYAVPCDWLENPEGCVPDPVYDGMIGPSVKVTIRDND